MQGRRQGSAVSCEQRHALSCEAAPPYSGPLTQELGGKSANILLPDVDLAAAVAKGVAGCFLNSGQSCDAPTRMFVPLDREPPRRAGSSRGSGMNLSFRHLPRSACSPFPASGQGYRMCNSVVGGGARMT